MDTWFLSKAANWCYLGLCQVYAAVDDLGIVGFFSLSPTSIAPRSLTASLRHGKNAMEHPGILLGRIAVRLDLQRTSQKVGTSLLHHAVKRSVDIADMVGGRFVVLDAKNEGLASWYARHEFRPLKDNPLRMVLPMKDAHALVKRLGEDYFKF